MKEIIWLSGFEPTYLPMYVICQLQTCKLEFVCLDVCVRWMAISNITYFTCFNSGHIKDGHVPTVKLSRLLRKRVHVKGVNWDNLELFHFTAKFQWCHHRFSQFMHVRYYIPGTGYEQLIWTQVLYICKNIWTTLKFSIVNHRNNKSLLCAMIWQLPRYSVGK